MSDVRFLLFGVFLCCFISPATYLNGQGLQASARLLSLDFNRDNQWNPLSENLKFPSGGGLFIGTAKSRYLTIGGDLRIGQVTNAKDELIVETEGENIFSLTGAVKVQHTGSRFWLKPFLQVGVGAQVITNEDGIKPAINLGAGMDIKLFKNIYLNVGSSFSREISRNRFFLDYGVGLTFALLDDQSNEEKIDNLMSEADDDFDGDGIADVDDQCPDLPGHLASGGCPDKDADGIADHLDNCPDEAGLVSNNGCPMFAEEDEIIMNDGSISTSADNGTEILDTVSNLNIEEIQEIDTNFYDVVETTPINSHSDIVEQVEDTSTIEITTPEIVEIEEETDRSYVVDSVEDSLLIADKGETNSVATDEKEDIRDGQVVEIENVDTIQQPLPPVSMDGNEPSQEVATSDRKGNGNAEMEVNRDELNTPKEENQVGAKSTFIDSDADGIADDIDKCPNLPGTLDNQGCPVSDDQPSTNLEMTSKTSASNVISESSFLQAQVHFPVGLASIRPQDIPALEGVAQIVESKPNCQLEIYGHTDSDGSNELNDLLSKRRAHACYLYLVYLGVNPNQMTYHGYGELQPVTSNVTAEGKYINRRVAFRLVAK